MKTDLALIMAIAAMSTSPVLAQDIMSGEPDTPSTDTAPMPPVGPEPAPMPDAATPPAEPASPPVDDMEPAEEAASQAEMTPEQEEAYAAWPATVQSYYDSLTPERQALFERIADADKVKLAALPEERQEQAWTSLEQQAAMQVTEPES